MASQVPAHSQTWHTESHHPGDWAYLGTWASLALFILSFRLAFVAGDGMARVFGTSSAEPPGVLPALGIGIPAAIVFSLPVLVAVVLAIRAARYGRPDARIPAVVAVIVAVGFIALNIVSYVVSVVS